MGQSTGQKQAQANLQTNQGTAAGALNTVNPIYSQMASGTDGLNPTQMSNALTASSQSAGGGMSSAVGQGGLLAARTGNAGGATAAIDDAARTAGVTNSANALGVQNQSDAIARSNQAEGLSGLNAIYQGSNGQATGSLNAYNSAAPSPLLGLANGAIGAAGLAAPTIGKAFGL